MKNLFLAFVTVSFVSVVHAESAIQVTKEEVIQEIGFNAGGLCHKRDETNEKEVYECRSFSVKPFNFLIRVTEFHTSDLEGVQFTVSPELDGKKFSDEWKRSLMQTLAEISLKYFQSLDVHADWDRTISNNSIAFNDPKALTANFSRGDHATVSFTELSAKENLQIFIGSCPSSKCIKNFR